MVGTAPGESHPFTRRIRAVLVVDVVESVRLIQRDEEGVVRRWRNFLDAVTHAELPTHGGRMVKSLGDGMLIELDSAPSAVRCALAMQARIAGSETGVEPSQQIRLRMGAHIADVIVDDIDLFGEGVNLAARLAALAGPGEIVVSAETRDGLTANLDADIEDLGECHLKHLQQPVRAYRIGPPGQWPVIEPGSSVMPALQPMVAVIPFTGRAVTNEYEVLGEMLADEVISALSRTPHLNVISRLSTTVFRGRNASLSEIGALLKTDYVLSGTYRVAGNQLIVVAELADTKSGRVVWGDQLKGTVTGVVSGDDPLIDSIVAAVSSAVVARELERARFQALPTLESYTLLLGAIALMHRASEADFDRARQLLETLTDRLKRAAAPHAWLAKWHVLRFTRGWIHEQSGESKYALECTRRALDLDPNCSLALTIDGFVHTNLLKRLDTGLERYEEALRVNPNDSLAWLLKGTLHAFKGEGQMAVEHTDRALALSPLDPIRYFYESLAATAALSAGQYERAIELAQHSIRSNRVHTSTLRALAISQSLLGRLEEARQTVHELRSRDPSLTTRTYLERSPSGAYETGKLWSEALRRAGIPE